jgi:hypothetical protein
MIVTERKEGNGPRYILTLEPGEHIEVVCNAPAQLVPTTLSRAYQDPHAVIIYADPEPDPRPAFTVQGWKDLPTGRLAYVQLRKASDDFGYLLNQEITLDGNSYICVCVECGQHPPVEAGTMAVLHVKDIEEEDAS